MTRAHPLFLLCFALHLTSVSRTNKAVLAVNGFAADGNMFVKTVRQRLEVRNPIPPKRVY